MRRVTPSLGTEHGCSHLCSEVTHWREVEHPPTPPRLLPFLQTEGEPSQEGLVAILAWHEARGPGQQVPPSRKGPPAGRRLRSGCCEPGTLLPGAVRAHSG